jgi:hypothetical protein
VRRAAVFLSVLLATAWAVPARADWNGDGPADVLSIYPDGRLVMYRGNGAGGGATGIGIKVGGGW